MDFWKPKSLWFLFYKFNEFINEWISENYPLENLWITFEVSSIKKNYNRSYLKIQDLFAKIGGIFNAFFIVTKVLTTHYFKYNFLMSLREFLNPKKDALHIHNFNFQKNNESNNSKLEEEQRKNQHKVLINLQDLQHAIRKNQEEIEPSQNNNENEIKNDSKYRINDWEREKESRIKQNNFTELGKNKNISNLNLLNNQKFISVDENKLSSSLNFMHYDIEKLNYFKFLYSSLFCKKIEVKIYNSLQDESKKLLDLFSFCQFLKTQYTEESHAQQILS